MKSQIPPPPLNVMSILPSSAVSARLFVTGSTLGPVVDSLHNQCLLRYNVAPVTIEWPSQLYESIVVPTNNAFIFNEYLFTSSWIVPPLLGVAYIVLGGILPKVFQLLFNFMSNLVATNRNSFQESGESSKTNVASRKTLLTKAALAVVSTASIIKFSEFLVLNPLFGNEVTSQFTNIPEKQRLVLLYTVAIIQWIMLDGTLAALLAAFITSIGGPLSEIPFVAAGMWEYLPEVADKYPLQGLLDNSKYDDITQSLLTILLGTNWEDLGISSASEPCYFAVTLDAIAVGRLFSYESPDEGN